jgi:hypothetical protein
MAFVQAYIQVLEEKNIIITFGLKPVDMLRQALLHYSQNYNLYVVDVSGSI